MHADESTNDHGVAGMSTSMSTSSLRHTRHTELLVFVCRYVADSGGAFVQPATYEAFGLTVIEVGSNECSADVPAS